MKRIDADVLKETLDKIPARGIENADGRAYVLIRLSTVFEIIEQMPSAQSETTHMFEGSIKDSLFFYCEECGEPVHSEYNYCPRCGRKFEVVEWPT